MSDEYTPRHSSGKTSSEYAGQLIPASVRRRAYPIALAVIAVLVAYGVLDGEHAAAWSNLAAAIVGAATAGLGTAYRPTTHADTTTDADVGGDGAPMDH